MAMGMEILLQSLGIDPEVIRKSITEVQTQFTLVNDRLARMEAKLDAALAGRGELMPGQKTDTVVGAKNGDSDSHTGAGAGAVINGAGAAGGR